MKNRLREIREAKRYTQLKVALDLNMNQNSISRYENGTRDLNSETLVAFSKYYNVSIDYILYQTDIPNKNN